MKMRFLGKTGMRVSALCLGTGNFDSTGMYAGTGHLDQKEADAIVGMAFDYGINFFNTAEIYSDGRAESCLGKALGKRRKEAIVITKVYPNRAPGENNGGFSRKHIIEGCEASLKRLETDYIDLYELHFFDPDTPLEVTIRVLDDLVRAGKIRYFGCSNFAAWQLMKGLSISRLNGWDAFVSLEALYNLMSRGLEYELTPLCVDQGIAILCFSPLHGGFLSGKYSKDKPWPAGTRFDKMEPAGPWPVEPQKLYSIIDRLEKIAERYGVSVSQVALNYILQKPAVCSAIIGVRNAAQLEENVKATDWDMESLEIAEMDHVSEPERNYPYMIFDPLKI